MYGGLTLPVRVERAVEVGGGGTAFAPTDGTRQKHHFLSHFKSIYELPHLVPQPYRAFTDPLDAFKGQQGSGTFRIIYAVED